MAINLPDSIEQVGQLTEIQRRISSGSNKVIIEEKEGKGPLQLHVLKEVLEKKGYNPGYDYVCKIIPIYLIEKDKIKYHMGISIGARG